MKKESILTKKGTAGSLAVLIVEVRRLIQSARHSAATAVNAFQVLTNYEIGRRIVEHEQKGAKRAGYGDELLQALSRELTREFGAGFSSTNLKLMRRFYVEFGRRLGREGARDSDLVPIGQTVSAQSGPEVPAIKNRTPFPLSWSHYVFLLTIKNPEERRFYEIESTTGGWSLAELKRQKSVALYERLALSRDKEGVKRLAEKGQLVTKPEDVLKEPYVLEFLGLDEKAGYSENELESAIITHIEKFLLELGKGFLFEARQKRLTFDEDHFFVDLVFYNRLLRCYVVIDLKLDKITHQDLGQMQMYVNYFDRHVKQPEENPTIGILLCKRKKDAIVELTLPKGANIHAKEYQLYLPSKDLLTKKLNEWTRESEPNA